MAEKPLQLILRPSSRLSKAQKALYPLICKKLKTNTPITYKEAKKIYLTKACQQIVDGVPHHWNYWWRNEDGEMVGRYEPLQEDEIRARVFLWLTQNIGALVLRGYLKIIPQIELS